MRALRLYLINPTNPLVSCVTAKENRWNKYRIWKPLGLPLDTFEQRSRKLDPFWPAASWPGS
jgi:hypothetical protein